MKKEELSLGTNIGKHVVWFSEVTSTNNECQKLLPNAVDGTVVISDYQTQGRGQRENGWESAPKKNMLFSVIFKPEGIKAENQFLISQFVSLGVVQFLGLQGIKASIKWPNDIYVGDKKICGILIENDIMGEYISASVAGIGINANQEQFVSGAPNPTSMYLETGRHFDLQQCFTLIFQQMSEIYQTACKHPRKIKNAYFKTLYRGDGFYTYESDEGKFEARITAIKPTGELVLKTKEGKLKTFLFKEVRFCL